MSSLRISPDRTAVCVIAASALVFGVVAYAARWRWARVTPAPPTTTPAAPPAAKQGEVVKDQAPPGGSSTGVAAGRHLVVNYFYQRKCNYGCYFCFHTEKSLPVSEAEQAMDMEELSRGKQFSREDKERGLRNLKAHGMERVTFSGGEPFFNAAELGGLVDFCKEVLGVKVAIVSNGSLIKKRWMEKHAKNLDVLTISCDSFDGSTLMEIGRVEKYKADPAAAAAAHIKKVRGGRPAALFVFSIGPLKSRVISILTGRPAVLQFVVVVISSMYMQLCLVHYLNPIQWVLMVIHRKIICFLPRSSRSAIGARTTAFPSK